MMQRKATTSDISKQPSSRLGIASADIIVVAATRPTTPRPPRDRFELRLLCEQLRKADLRKAGSIAIYRDPADLLAYYDKYKPLWPVTTPERSSTGLSQSPTRPSCVFGPAEFERGTRCVSSYLVITRLLAACAGPKLPAPNMPTSGMTDATGGAGDGSATFNLRLPRHWSPMTEPATPRRALRL